MYYKVVLFLYGENERERVKERRDERISVGREDERA